MPQPSDLNDGTEKMQKNLDHDIRDMISTLTGRLTNLHRLQRSAEDHDDHHPHDNLEPDHGVRIITLAGNNIGATMRGERDEKSTLAGKIPGQSAPSGAENEGLSTYVNSNFQAINNSIMMGGSYTAQDPGVHMDISDCLENKESSSASHDDQHASGHDKKGKKKKKHSKSEHDDQLISE